WDYSARGKTFAPIRVSTVRQSAVGPFKGMDVPPVASWTRSEDMRLKLLLIPPRRPLQARGDPGRTRFVAARVCGAPRVVCSRWLGEPQGWYKNLRSPELDWPNHGRSDS